MKIYKLSQDVNNGYDTYDSAIVCAKDKEEARNIHVGDSDTWVVDVKKIKVEYIGKAKNSLKKGIVLSSFNAG